MHADIIQENNLTNEMKKNYVVEQFCIMLLKYLLTI